MCIRDRRVAGRLDFTGDGEVDVFGRWAGHGAPGQVGPRRTPEPVSYTHLRAHETVLDLVCRLLLEKKKYKIFQTDSHIQQINQSDNLIRNQLSKNEIYT